MRRASGNFCNAGLFNGSGGLVWVLRDFANWDDGLAPVFERTARRWLDSLTLPPAASARPDQADLFDGVSGRLVIIAALAISEVLSPAVAQQARTRLRTELDWLTLVAARGRVPWFVPAYLMGDKPESIHPDYRFGQFPVGAAHGAAGLLTGLGAAHRILEAPAAADSLEEISTWVIDHAVLEDGTFAGAVGATVDGSPDEQRKVVTPMSWCNGSDAIAAAVLGAADMTGSQAARAAAHRALWAASGSAYPLRPGLCHGSDGGAILRRVATDRRESPVAGPRQAEHSDHSLASGCAAAVQVHIAALTGSAPVEAVMRP
ncbi:MAG: lanthionine synthetase LanC family protein [Streptosporangiaceae bacterium]